MGFNCTISTVSQTIESTSTSGTIDSGLMEISVANIGSSDGTLDGVTIPAGTVVTYRGYWDAQKGHQKRLSAMTYDATGTTFLITTIP